MRRVSIVLSGLLLLSPLFSFSQSITKVATIPPSSKSVNSVSISPNGQILLRTGDDGTIELFSTANGELIRKLPDFNMTDVVGSDFINDQKFVVATTSRVQFFDINNLESYTSLFLVGIEWFNIHEDGSKILIKGAMASNPYSSNIYQVDLSNTRVVEEVDLPKSGEYKYTNDDKIIRTANNTVDFYDAGSFEKLKSFELDYKIKSVDYSSIIGYLYVLTSNSTSLYLYENGKNINKKDKYDSQHLLPGTTAIIYSSDQEIIIKNFLDSKYKSHALPFTPKLVTAGNQGYIASVGGNNANTIILRFSGQDLVKTANVQTATQNRPTQVKSENSTTEVNSDIINDDFIYQTYKTEIEKDLELKRYLSRPQGEFEKTTEYNKRLNEWNSFKVATIQVYKQAYEAKQELKKQEEEQYRQLQIAFKNQIKAREDSIELALQARRQNMLRQSIIDSYELIVLSIDQLGRYDPDTELFPITISGKTEYVSVPIEDQTAEFFAQNYSSAVVTAEVQLLADGVTSDTFNILIQNPLNFEFYEFGDQRPPLFIEDDQKKSREIVQKLDSELQAQRLIDEKKKIEEENYDKTTQLFINSLEQRKFHALLIGVEEYVDDNIPDLQYPIDDAEKLKEVLIRDYSFQEENILFLKNPTRNEVADAFYQLEEQIDPTSSLLVFYAGHGEWDEKIEQGYWLPSNAQLGRIGNYLSNSDIRDFIKMLDTKHTLLVSDACFSGGILSERSLPNFQYKAELEMYKHPSRKAVTSGTLKTVPDRSVFMKYFIKYLEENNSPLLSAEDLYFQFRKPVSNNTGNLPQYGAITGTNDEDGDFIFLKKTKN